MPIDFSEQSANARRYATMLGEKFAPCAVEAVHVLNFFQSHRNLIQLPLHSRELANARERLKKALPGADGIHVFEGAVLKGILDTARDVQADLIVMG